MGHPSHAVYFSACRVPRAAVWLTCLFCPTDAARACSYIELLVGSDVPLAASAPLPLKGKYMNLSLHLGPIVSLIAGVLILIMPRLLNYIVAVYLIVIGVIGLFGTGSLRL